jgi:hypothetical protein
VVDGLRGGRCAEGGPELRVVEEPEEERAQVRVAHLGAESSHLRKEIVGIESRLRGVVGAEGQGK